MKATRDYMKCKTIKDNRVSFDDDSIGLEISPTLKRQINYYFQSYYEDWINKNIPALGGQTPVEAARTDSGKNLLRELLKQIENEGVRDDINGLPPFPDESNPTSRLTLNILATSAIGWLYHLSLS